MKDSRRHRRFPWFGPVQISWDEGRERRYSRGRCTDVSESGLRLKLPVPVAPMTEILLSTERIRITGPARVRYCARYGSRYLIGVELSHRLCEELLEAEIVRAQALSCSLEE